VPLISLKEVLSPEELANRSLLHQKDMDYDGQLLGNSSATGESGVPESVEEERRHVIEAALMRIMKSRKRLSHHDLIAESTRQLSTRFTPTPAVTIAIACCPSPIAVDADCLCVLFCCSAVSTSSSRRGWRASLRGSSWSGTRTTTACTSTSLRDPSWREQRE
jgi:hypothetical protein